MSIGYKIGSAIVTGMLAADKEYTKSESLGKALTIGAVSGITSIYSIGNKLGKYFDETDVVASTFVSSVFDVGQSFTVFSVNKLISYTNLREKNYYISRKRVLLLDEI